MVLLIALWGKSGIQSDDLNIPTKIQRTNNNQIKLKEEESYLVN